MNTYQPPTRIEALRSMSWGDRIITAAFTVLALAITARMTAQLVVAWADQPTDWNLFLILAGAVSACTWVVGERYWRHRALTAEHHITTRENLPAITPDIVNVSADPNDLADMLRELRNQTPPEML